MPPTVKWEGVAFSIYDINNTTWPDLPGVYMFVGVNQNDEWFPLYVGRTIRDTLAQRLASHRRLREAKRLGAVTIHLVVRSSPAGRKSLEQRLYDAYDPRMNQVRPS